MGLRPYGCSQINFEALNVVVSVVKSERCLLPKILKIPYAKNVLTDLPTFKIVRQSLYGRSMF